MTGQNAGIMAPLLRGTAGDVNAGFAFLLDCVVNLFVLSVFLGYFGYPVEIIKNHIIPGALVGIIVGNILNVRMALRVARESGNPNITAMPLGLDLPTTIGMALFVVGPVFKLLEGEMGTTEAALIAWYVGMAGTIWMGLIKFGLSYFSQAVRRFMPIAALLGPMLGVAIVWLGANAVLGVFEIPEVGLISLGIMIYALIAGQKLPFALPGAIIAIVLASLAFYALGESGYLASYVRPSSEGLGLFLPIPSFGGLETLFGRSLNYLAVIIPFGLLIAASTVNVTAGANILGDDYKPDELMRADAVATIVGALFGNVVQTTPYFGHATYKRLGARTAYSAGVALILAVGGVLGIIGFLVDVLPGAAIKPVLIVVACDIARVTFKGVTPEQAPAVAFGIMPAILNFAHVKVGELYLAVEIGLADLGEAATAGTATMQTFLPEMWMTSYTLLGAMARGYILTGILWAATVSLAISGKNHKAAGVMFLAAVLSLFGVIHSVLPSSEIYLPWMLGEMTDSVTADLPYHLATGYALAALSILVFAHLNTGNHVKDAATEDIE